MPLALPLPAPEGVSTVVAALGASVATVVIAPTTAVMVRTGRPLEEEPTAAACGGGWWAAAAAAACSSWFTIAG